MAINEVPQTPKQKRYGFVTTHQSTWGTAGGDSDAVTEIECEPFEINRDIKEIIQPGSHGSRNLTDSDVITHTKGVMPTFTVTGTANHNSFDQILAATFQNVTEGAATPYSKSYTFSSTQPNFAANAGYFYTWIERDPTASKSCKVADCIVKSLTMTLEAGEPLKYTAEWVGRGLASITSNPSGTWTRDTATDLWHFHDFDTITIASTSYHLVSAEITLGHDIIPVGQDGSGNPATFAMTNRQATFKVKVVKDTDWETSLGSWAGNTVIAFRIGSGHATPGTTDGDLDFAFRGKLNSGAKAHDDIIAGELSGTMLMADDGGTEPITVVLANAVDRTW